jgi:hypothetical protein
VRENGMLNDRISKVRRIACDEAAKLYEDTVNWLLHNYSAHRFFTERDIVWTIQLHLLQEIERRRLYLQVFDNHKMPNKIQVDLVLVEPSNSSALVVAELKYEPDHARVDISPGKLHPSKVFWDSPNSGVVQDISRIETLIDGGLSEAGYVTLIDEGGHHSWREEPRGSIWDRDCGKSPYSDNRIAALLFKRQRE